MTTNVSPASLGITPTTSPEVLEVLDNNGNWVPIGTVLGGSFTPVGGGTPSGGGGNAFDTIVGIQAASLVASVQSITCGGVSAAGDLLGDIMVFKRVASGSAGMPYVRSADRFLPGGGSTTDPTNGGWWKLANNIVMPEMFGAKRDGTTDDYAAIQATIHYAESLIISGSVGASGIACKFTPGNYACHTGLVSVEGVRYFVESVSESSNATSIVFPAAFAGPFGWHFPDVGGNSNSTVGNITLVYGSGSGGTAGGFTPAPIHGWLIEQNIHMLACAAEGWPGNGFHINGASDGNGFWLPGSPPGPIGSADACEFRFCLSLNNGYNGFFGYGNNFNVSTFYMCSSIQNQQWGYRDEHSELGNVYIMCHTSGNGGSNWVNGTVVRYGGKTYSVTPVSTLQNTDFALTLPAITAPGTDTPLGSVWTLLYNTTFSGLGTDWAPGGPQRNSGGGFFTNSTMHRPYCEDGQGPSIFLGNVFDLSASGINGGSGVVPYTSGQVRFLDGGFTVVMDNPTGGYERITYNVGNIVGGRSNGTTTFSVVQGTVSGTFIYSIDPTTLQLNFNTQGSAAGWYVNPQFPNANTPKFGASAAPAGQFAVGAGIGLGSFTNPGGMVLGAAASQPTGGNRGIGWFSFATGATAVNAGLLGWQTTSQGAPGNQLPIYGAQTPIFPPMAVAALPGFLSSGIGARGIATDASLPLAAGLGLQPVSGSTVAVSPVFSPTGNTISGLATGGVPWPLRCRVIFTVSGAGALPAGVTAGQPYLISVSSATVAQITNEGGTPVTFSSAGAAPQTATPTNIIPVFYDGTSLAYQWRIG